MNLAHRQPQKKPGFSWGRFPTSDGSAVTWRLFRRDCHNALHAHSLTYFAAEPPARIAADLRRARHQLREKVDGIQFQEWGMTA